MTNEAIRLFDAIYTTRAIRRFKTDPVPDALHRRVLEAGGQAPSGGNRQPWRFIVLRSAESRRKLKELLVLARGGTGTSAAASTEDFADAPIHS